MLNLHEKVYKDTVRLLLTGSQVFLYIGDRGIGKRTLVRQIGEKLKAKIVEYDFFKVDDARSVKQVCSRVLNQTHIFIINSDTATSQALNAMLKLLEEPPFRCGFFLCGSVVPMQTIASRGKLQFFPRLTDEELLEILRIKGMTASVAISLLPFARGSVEGAMKAYERVELCKAMLPYFKCLIDRDEKALVQQIRSITRKEIDFLLGLCDDLLMSRYQLSDNILSISPSPEFLQSMKDALLRGQIPAIAWQRAWQWTA